MKASSKEAAVRTFHPVCFIADDCVFCDAVLLLSILFCSPFPLPSFPLVDINVDRTLPWGESNLQREEREEGSEGLWRALCRSMAEKGGEESSSPFSHPSVYSVFALLLSLSLSLFPLTLLLSDPSSPSPSPPAISSSSPSPSSINPCLHG